MKHRPSSLPMLKQCPRFESGTAQSFAEDGAIRHAALASNLRGDGSWADCLDSEEDSDAVQWAAGYIRLHAPTSDYPLVIEEKATWAGPDFSERTGTPDCVCGPVLFDFKWRRQDYAAQVADYACGVFQKRNNADRRVTVHILYGAENRAEIIHFDGNDDCLRIVGEILERTENPKSEPTPCDYCGWCARRLTCPALIRPALEVIKHREGVGERDRERFAAWLESGAHTTTITDADTMGAVLRIARVVSDFAEAAEYTAREMALKSGLIPTGFKLQERRGNRYVTSVATAFEKAGLPQDLFLKACDVKFSALAEAHGSLHGLKKTSAEREVESRLGDAVQRKASSVSLVAERNENPIN